MYISIVTDWDNDVIDVLLNYSAQGESVESWIKAFDDTEWKEASQFAEAVAEELKIPFVGDRTEN